MSAEPYKVNPDSELGHLIDRAPLLLEKDGKRFRLVGDAEDFWAGYDSDAVLAGMDAAVGSISAEEAERFKRLIYEGREAGTRPLSRP
jgi:hypothetical protein